MTLTGAGDADGLDASFVTPEFFRLLGVKPLAGRLFEANDNVKGAAPVAILSEGLWRRRFAADPAVVGRGITLDSTGFTVVGVMPQDFEFPYQADRIEIWAPMVADPFVASLMEGRGASFMNAIGRLRPGATVGQAQSELAAIAARLAEQYPHFERGPDHRGRSASRRHRQRLPTRPRAAARRRRRRPVDSLRERRQPAARARRGPSQGDRDSHRARRGSRPPDPPAADRVGGAGDRGRRGRRHPGAVGRRRAGRHHAAGDPAAASGACRRRRPRVRDTGLDGHGNRLRRGAGAAVVARRITAKR